MDEILENVVLRKKFSIVFELFKHFIKITALSVLHYDAEFIFGGVINFLESDDILVFDHVMELSLEQSLLFFFGFKMAYVNTFHDIKFVIFELTFDKVDFAHGALSEDFDFSVLFLLVSGRALSKRNG